MRWWPRPTTPNEEQSEERDITRLRRALAGAEEAARRHEAASHRAQEAESRAVAEVAAERAGRRKAERGLAKAKAEIASVSEQRADAVRRSTTPRRPWPWPAGTCGSPERRCGKRNRSLRRDMCSPSPTRRPLHCERRTAPPSRWCPICPGRRATWSIRRPSAGGWLKRRPPRRPCRPPSPTQRPSSGRLRPRRACRRSNRLTTIPPCRPLVGFRRPRRCDRGAARRGCPRCPRRRPRGGRSPHAAARRGGAGRRLQRGPMAAWPDLAPEEERIRLLAMLDGLQSRTGAERDRGVRRPTQASGVTGRGGRSVRVRSPPRASTADDVVLEHDRRLPGRPAGDRGVRATAGGRGWAGPGANVVSSAPVPGRRPALRSWFSTQSLGRAVRRDR